MNEYLNQIEISGITYDLVASGGTGSGVTPAEVQEMINQSISGLSGDTQIISGDVVDLSQDVQNISGDIIVLSGDVIALEAKLDALSGNVYTKAETDEKIEEAVSGKTDFSDFSAHTANTSIHLTSGDVAVQMSAYTYDKQTIDDKIASGGTFDPTIYYKKSETSGKTELADEFAKYYKKEETSSKTEISDALNEINASAFTSASYDSTGKTIDFKNKNGVKVASIDATAFIKDGMVDTVSLIELSGDTYLHIVFNTDAGKEAIDLNIGDIFEADNYYLKTETSSKTEIDDALDLKQDLLIAGDYITIDSANTISTSGLVTVADNEVPEYYKHYKGYFPAAEESKAYWGGATKLTMKTDLWSGNYGESITIEVKDNSGNSYSGYVGTVSNKSYKTNPSHFIPTALTEMLDVTYDIPEEEWNTSKERNLVYTTKVNYRITYARDFGGFDGNWTNPYSITTDVYSDLLFQGGQSDYVIETQLEPKLDEDIQNLANHITDNNTKFNSINNSIGRLGRFSSLNNEVRMHWVQYNAGDAYDTTKRYYGIRININDAIAYGQNFDIEFIKVYTNETLNTQCSLSNYNMGFGVEYDNATQKVFKYDLEYHLNQGDAIECDDYRLIRFKDSFNMPYPLSNQVVGATFPINVELLEAYDDAYNYATIGYVNEHSGGSYEAGSGITIENDVISTSGVVSIADNEVPPFSSSKTYDGYYPAQGEQETDWNKMQTELSLKYSAASHQKAQITIADELGNTYQVSQSSRQYFTWVKGQGEDRFNVTLNTLDGYKVAYIYAYSDDIIELPAKITTKGEDVFSGGQSSWVIENEIEPYIVNLDETKQGKLKAWTNIKIDADNKISVDPFQSINGADSESAFTPSVKAVYDFVAAHSGITSGDVQTMIDSSISGKADNESIIRLNDEVADLASDIEDAKDSIASLSGSSELIELSAITNADYDSVNKVINFYNISGTVVDNIDATDFIKDGMIEDVEIVTVSGVSYLRITFNTESGHENIDIDLSQIFDASNYYTKTEVNTLIQNKADVWCGSTSEWAQISGSTQPNVIYLVY